MENYYKNTIEKWMVEGKCGEEAARQMNAIIDEKIMEKIRKEDKGLFWSVMRDLHEACEGYHYNEPFALWEVSQMHSADAKGEHWSLEKVAPLYAKVKPTLPASVTVYDLYVALNSFWHDNIKMFTAWFSADADAKIIDSAINYFFMDSDAPDGKIWRYYRSMSSYV